MEAKKAIMDAASRKFGRHSVRACSFNHGQWSLDVAIDGDKLSFVVLFYNDWRPGQKGPRIGFEELYKGMGLRNENSD